MTINVLFVGLIVVMTVMGAFAGYFFKRASGKIDFKNLKTLFCCAELYLGGFLYVAAAFLNIYVLRYLDYSLVLPLTSLTYIWTMPVSYFLLGEKVTVRKVAGTVLVLAGAVLLAVS